MEQMLITLIFKSKMLYREIQKGNVKTVELLVKSGADLKCLNMLPQLLMQKNKIF